MGRTTSSATAAERLTNDLVEGTPQDPIARELAGWLAGSPRFRAFAQANAAKVRKKLRGASDLEARRDVRAELLVAHLLMGDRRIELAFEAYGSGKGGPDFTVSFRGERPFNLEVTRLRRAPTVSGLGGTILAKLRQLPPGTPNALLVAIEDDSAEAADITAAARTLRARADRKDDEFFTRRGFDGTKGFYERFLRLGGVLVWCESAAGDRRGALWTNGSARIALPDRAVRACLLNLRAV
jgi:hypothetical protein